VQPNAATVPTGLLHREEELLPPSLLLLLLPPLPLLLLLPLPLPPPQLLLVMPPPPLPGSHCQCHSLTRVQAAPSGQQAFMSAVSARPPELRPPQICHM
jgi:hypothetical protein